jgi:hypothetical protein
MPATSFDALPDDARLWVFGAARPLAAPEADAVLARADAFLAGWAAHGAPVVGARTLLEGRFLLVGADERATGVSGCSIDALFRTLATLEGEIDVPLTDVGTVFWRDRDGTVRGEPRPAFRARVRAGEVDGSTPVFDTTIATVGEYRGGGWERAMASAWHAKAFAR